MRLANVSLIESVTHVPLPPSSAQRMALVESRHNPSQEESETFVLSRSENEDSEDGFNPAVTKILGIPRSPIVSEPFMIPALVREGGSSEGSSPEERDPISTRAISPPSSTTVTVTTASGNGRKGDKISGTSTSPTSSVTVVNGMIHDPNYQELCQQLMHLGVGPSSPVKQGFASPTMTRVHSPPAVHNGEGRGEDWVDPLSV